jgi:arylsulfatase
LKQRPRDKPFMLSVCFFAPHSQDGTDEQYFPQEESMSLYANETVEIPVSATEDAWKKLPHFFGEINEGRRRWRIRFDTPEKQQSMMKNYYRLITEIDQTSKVIYKELEAQGVLDNTMIIFTTDNGLFHAEHQLAGKWFPHQESIRVPLIIKDPRMPKEKVGTVNDDFTLNIDLASTILAAAGVKQPTVMQGRDIADLYLTKDPKWREEFFYEHPMHLEKQIIPASTALVRKNYKFMTWPDYKVEQLFNLESDPYELEDIIAEADLQDVITEMRQRHDELQKAALEPGPIDETGERMRGSATTS